MSKFLPAFIEKYPGQRLRLWWLYQNEHGLRLRLDKTGALPGSEDSPERPDEYIIYGVHTMWRTPKRKKTLSFESQATFLKRHGLLTTDEKAYLKKHKKLFEPEIFEILPEKDTNAVSAVLAQPKTLTIIGEKL